MIDTTFLTSGNATLIVLVPVEAQDKGHRSFYQYRFEAVEDKIFVRCLNGEGVEKYLGCYNAETGEVYTTRNSWFGNETNFVRVIQRLVAALHAGKPIPWGLSHGGKCGRCGRESATPIGPVCRKILAEGGK